MARNLNWAVKISERGKRRKNILARMHGEACAYCDVTGPDCIFDFHHLKEQRGRLRIGLRLRNASREDFKRNIIPEVMEECIMLCANCHRIETWAQ